MSIFKHKLLYRSGALLVILTSLLCGQTSEHNCYSILVGKKASASGAVLFAHNEDDWDEQVVYWHKVPRMRYTVTDTIVLKNGGKLPQIAETCAYLWLELPGMEFGDSYLNEYGVTIASNACRSRKKDARLTDGGIDYDLRRILAERARSAREAVKIAGRLIQRFGYNSSGRTYCIADPNEAWMLAIVYGKIWVAQRVPDEKVVIIPNYYVIQNIDLGDTLNFLGARDAVSFAILQGWYQPAAGHLFNFRQTYSDFNELTNPDNITRHWQGLNLLSEKPYRIEDELPCAFQPKNKITRTDMMQVLRSHYQPAPDTSANPHQQERMTICSVANQYGFVAELRSWLPAEIGAIWWIAPRRPCIQPFVPLYAGTEALPPDYSAWDVTTARRLHFNLPENVYTPDLKIAYWLFDRRVTEIDESWGKLSTGEARRALLLEQQIVREFEQADVKITKRYQTRPAEGRRLITEWTINALQYLIRFNQ